MATQNNVDRPESSDTESDQEGKILETHGITSMVHEIKVNGYHLVEQKQEILVDTKASDYTPEMTILIHSRSILSDDPSIDDRCYVVQENITEYEVIRTEGKKFMDQNETEMTPKEVNKFEEDWIELYWKSLKRGSPLLLLH